MSVYWLYFRPVGQTDLGPTQQIDPNPGTVRYEAWWDRKNIHFLDGTVDGLRPASSYAVSVITRDACANEAQSAETFLNTASDPSETEAPQMSTIEFWTNQDYHSPYPVLSVFARDATGMNRVELFVDGRSVGWTAYGGLSCRVGSSDFGCSQLNNLGNPTHAFNDELGRGEFFYIRPANADVPPGTHRFEMVGVDALGNRSSSLVLDVNVPAGLWK